MSDKKTLADRAKYMREWKLRTGRTKFSRVAVREEHPERFQDRATYVRDWRLRTGRTTTARGTPAVDLTGQVFGRLTVEGSIAGKRKQRQYLWACLCSCGNRKEVVTSHLKRGSVISCGCAVNARGSESKNWKGVGHLSSVRWHIMKNKAKYRKLEFSVSHEYLWELYVQQEGRCAHTGVEIDLGTWKGDYGTASLDRIDSMKGYTRENVQWVHRITNFMKQSLSEEEFLHWCTAIVDHAAQKKLLSRPSDTE